MITSEQLDHYIGLEFRDRQCSEYSADCLGFIGLFDASMFHVEMYGRDIDYCEAYIKQQGYSEDENGQLVVLRFTRLAFHFGYYSEGFLYHSSKNKGSVVKEDFGLYSKFIYKRFSKTPHGNNLPTI
jgi:hypothetical protein